ncbi:hypothetical protein [Roseivirga pacifica]|uniref:hypothetical protein n=1 Tax=Roseivirga pacifica TaxID=1267423 RepID=UPI003BAF2383
MRNPEIIEKAVGQVLQNGRLQSVVLDGKLVDKINVTFLQFDNWIRVVTTDEMTNLSEEKSVEVRPVDENEDFNLTIELVENHFPEFKKFIGKKLIDFKEIVQSEAEAMSFGLNLYFEDDLNFIIYNHDYPVDKNEYFFENSVPAGMKEK